MAVPSDTARPVGSVLAAEYVRMSTEHQRYSTQNQADHIREYATRRGYQVVKTYADDGKSGLSIDGRDGLKQLIRDVESKDFKFSVILIYDVSRWGRFQDADESAYYEYICRRAGIQVIYCAEQFENDGSLTGTIVKNLKRVMAGEYSRELSVKVFAGQCRLVELGFRQGGSPGYGLKRLLVNESGTAKGILSRGERKSLQTDRVVLVPGDEEETQTVQEIYRLLITEGLTETAIARRLNDQGVFNAFGRLWSAMTIREILTNEKYVGANVYNHTSFKLKKMHVHNPPDMWVRKDNAFEPLVSRATFAAAQEVLRVRTYRYSDDELLSQLRATYQQFGRLSALIIDEAGGVGSGIISSRFGGLFRAYQLVGYAPMRDLRYLEINRHIRSMHPEVVENTERLIAAVGGRTKRNSENDLIEVNGEFRVSIVIARCRERSAGNHSWKIRFDRLLTADINVAVRLDTNNREPLDYYLIPRVVLEKPRLTLGDFNAANVEGFRYDTLQGLAHLARRRDLRRIA